EERLSGLVVFVVARRLTVNGEFSGAASIAIPAIKMSEFWNSIDLGPFSTVSLVRDDGWLVSRHPQLPQAVNVSEAALFSTYIPAASTGFYHTVSAVDGRTRIAGYRKVADWPLFAVASIDRGEALAPFWTLVRAQMTFGIPVLVLLLAGTIWIARLLRADLLHRLELEQAHERNQLLFREIHHRVKNNLQAVASLVRLQPLPDEARDDMAQRIAAMVAVHEQIYQSDQFDRVEAAPYIERLVRDVATAYDSDVQLDLRLEPLRVSRDQALPLGLIVSEVVSNAFKHAFSKRQDGHLAV